jgi:general secretion pathway protein G
MKREQGFSLIELVITITVLTIMTLGVLPLVKVAVRRQKEQQLRDSLRQIRMAIDEFHRDTVGMQCTGGLGGAGLSGGGGGVGGGGGNTGGIGSAIIDPRSKVVISDCTIFGVDNPDRYPPDLETLVTGVNVMPRGVNPGLGNPNVSATQANQISTKQKIYLRALPIDPMTGKADRDMRSSNDRCYSGSWGGENVFVVRSKSKATALNGERYSEW